MAYNNDTPVKFPRRLQFESGVNIEQISGNRTLTYKDSQIQRLDAQSGGLDVLLPAPENGAMFIINCQGNAITVKQGSTTVKALSVGEGGLFACDGTNWKQFI